MHSSLASFSTSSLLCAFITANNLSRLAVSSGSVKVLHHLRSILPCRLMLVWTSVWSSSHQTADQMPLVWIRGWFYSSGGSLAAVGWSLQKHPLKTFVVVLRTCWYFEFIKHLLSKNCSGMHVWLGLRKYIGHVSTNYTTSLDKAYLSTEKQYLHSV